jgi:sugar lactone lactonase YvrE
MNARINAVLCAAGLALVAGCTGNTRPEPYRLETIAAALGGLCAAADRPADARFLPGGLAVVRDQGHETVLTSAGDCVVSIDSLDGTVAKLTTAGEFAASAIDATASAVFLVSRAAGIAKWLDPKTGKTVQALGGFQRPLGARLAPGDTAYVAEFDLGRIVRVRPTPDSRPAVVAAALAGPVDIIVTEPNVAYVTEMTGGRLTRIGLQADERKVVLKKLNRPQGMARLPDGRIAIVEAGLRRVIAVDLKGKSREVLFENLPIAAPGDAPPDYYAALGLGADGALYLISDLQGALVKLGPVHGGAKQ